MNYLAFDIEIARDLDRIPFEDFRPNIGEVIEVDIGGSKEEAWKKGTYEGDGIFATTEKTFNTEGLHWHPVDNKDWKRFRPLGITCAAAAASSDGGLWNWWAQSNGRFTDKLSKIKCQYLVRRLSVLALRGYILLTWNGLGFDFDILAEESGMHTECKELALGHIDMMFHFFASKGYPLGLDAAAKGMGLPGKPEGMDGAVAPRMWAAGEYHRVLDYVSWDAKNTLGLAQAVDNAYCLGWTARSGRQNTWHSEKWLTVKEAMDLPQPDTSWMTDPWPRSKFYEWTGYKPAVPAPPIDTSHLDPEKWQLFDHIGTAQWDPDEGNDIS